MTAPVLKTSVDARCLFIRFAFCFMVKAGVATLHARRRIRSETVGFQRGDATLLHALIDWSPHVNFAGRFSKCINGMQRNET